jgi:predicted  nucleic acid-binding Zn-ribbon protein
MNIRKSLLQELMVDLKKRLSDAEYKLQFNKGSIKHLAEEQVFLKKKRQEIGKLVGELQQQMEPRISKRDNK